MDTTLIEEWRPVALVEFSQFYEVSSLGRVRSLDRISRTKGDGKLFRPGRILRLQVNTRGYPCAYLRAVPHVRNATVHRLVACAFIENPLGLSEVNHIDLNKTNNAVTNLEWTSRLSNYLHAAENGAMKRFIRTLSDEDVKAIRDMVANSGRTNASIAADFGINPSTVSRIWNGLRRDRDHEPYEP